MKLVKLLGLASCMALAAMSLLGVSSAAAHTQVDLCESGETNCVEAESGDTFTASGTNIRLFNSSFGVENLCKKSSLAGEVLTALAEGAGEIDADITSINFTECEHAVTVAGLPWLLSSSDTLFSANLTGLVSGGVHVTIAGLGPFGENCLFQEDATHMVTATWHNNNPSSVTLGGSLVATSGCFGVAGNISGTYSVTGVNGGPGNVVILHS